MRDVIKLTVGLVDWCQGMLLRPVRANIFDWCLGVLLRPVRANIFDWCLGMLLRPVRANIFDLLRGTEEGMGVIDRAREGGTEEGMGVIDRAREGGGKGSGGRRAVPGPGTYETRSTFVVKGPTLNTEGIEVEHPPFLSQAKRFAPVKSVAPAPGTYNDPRTALDALKKVSGLKRSPFSQTAVRFNPDHQMKLTPGPGAYNVTGMGADSMRKAYLEATRKGVFGTTSSRSPAIHRRDEPDVPGPAHYQVKEKPFISRYHQLGSNFASVTTRMKDNGTKPEAPDGPASERNHLLRQTWKSVLLRHSAAEVISSHLVNHL
ncbi:hypothetical protein RRG08_010394 [Elysia crispata]|uniref:Sperm-tail PG-rich repeat-containing protein 2 n=1 Tax=Elysia crispata TaxID=231223 RepID=A0AAE1BAP6_9GAST|nr:hypothetical protein RRG08_010394 [Elysia crispata]